MNNGKKGFSKRINSFRYAFRGIGQLVRSEPNARIHLIATIIAISAGFALHISKTEWCIILIVIALVCAAEGFNTVIEKLSDHIFNEYHETARTAKDISAGVVLICSAAALVCGLIIFLPKLMPFFF
jgi:diacylglycerol kinase (ATP)